ncbi:hypothetical protein LBMAG56_00640 [Verrucomicrobiota bacterium]|nr:hypothetical protein LBMAG56_00640 [Verrucomicrobiota bacterium]
MKLVKSLAVLAFAAAVMVSVAMAADEKPKFKAGGCCDKAQKDGKECAHKCCVEAAKDKKVCEKCNAPAKKKA